MSSSAFKIDSPYAKLGSGGQITCTLCNAAVKSAKVWIAHVNGRQHREALAARSAKKLMPPPAQQVQTQKATVVKVDNTTLKRPAPTNGNNANNGAKKPKTTLDDQTPRQSQTSSTANKSAVSSMRSLVVTASDSESDSESDDDGRPTVKPKPEPVSASSALPADFFDAGTSSVVEQKSDQGDMGKAVAPKQPEAADGKPGELPEGFFDDRKKDAKVRGVELKDPLDDEWSKFQKEMQKVDVVSEQIVEEDEEQMTLERELDEAEEQMREWSRLNQLEKRMDTLVVPDKNAGTSAMEVSDESSGTDDEADDTNLEKVLDWRAKDVWR